MCANGTTSGDQPLSRGQIYYLLRNPVYLGQIRHKDKTWPGQHPAIIEDDLWNRVQSRMRAASTRGRSSSNEPGTVNDPGAWLTGKFRDETGDRLTPTHTTRVGRRLRYYVSNRLISGGKDPAGWRLPAPLLEKTVLNVMARHLTDAARTHRVLLEPDASTTEATNLLVLDLVARLATKGGSLGADLLSSGVLSSGRIELDLDGATLAQLLGIPVDLLLPDLLQVTAPFDLRRRGVETKIIVGDAHPRPAPHLHAMLIRAHGWAREMKSGVQLSDIAHREKVPGSFIRNRTQLAFLSSKIQAAILEGSQPPELTLKRLVSITHPLDWAEQERLFGFS